MFRSTALVLASFLFAVPALAQRHRAPPSPDTPRKVRRRAPPSGPKMPVRKPVEVKHFEPRSGPPGAVVTLFGEHFDETCNVRFNGRILRVAARAPDQLKVRIFPRAVTDHFVVTKAGFRDVTYEKVFHVVRPPRVNDFRPKRLNIGDQVTVLGQHFLPSDEFVLGTTELPVASFKPIRVLLNIPAGARPNRIGVKRGGRVVALSRARLDVLSAPPIVSGFTPPQGGFKTVVRVNGKNFEPGDRVELPRCKLKIKSRGDDFFEVLIGRRCTTGKFKVTGRHGRRALSGDLFQVVRPPVVKRFFPRFGPPGTVITLEGHGFLAGDQVTLDEAVLTVRTLVHNKIVVELPAGVGSGPLIIKRGTDRFRVRGAFHVKLPPVITNFNPRSGPPGTHITIEGDHFMRRMEVLLAGQKLKLQRRHRHRKNQNQIVAIVPPNGRTGKLTIHTAVGNVTSAIPFAVTPFAQVHSFFPLHGLPGTMVTIRGKHFHDGIKVFLGDTELRIVRDAPEQLELKIPKGTQSGKFMVMSFGRKLVVPGQFTVDQPKPAIEFDFNPKTQRRGREVTLILTPPTLAVTVFFNGRPLPKRTLENGRRIVVTIPGDARSGHFELEYKGDRYRAKDRLRVR